MSAFERLNIIPSLLQKNQQYSDTQEQTKDTFSFKWSKRDTYDSENFKAFSRQWLLEKYCSNDPGKLRKWLAGNRKIILDAGCGSGYSAILFFGDHLRNHDYLGVDISTAIEIAKLRFKEAGYSGDFLQANLLDLPIGDCSVDLIFSEGVLHHTDDTEESIKYLSKKLKKGGFFLFYVYVKKSVIREFTDDYIRQEIHQLTDEKAWEALKPLTKLGIALGKLNIDIEIPEDVPLLGIAKGKLDLQRFFYWHICKTYYRPEFSLEEMNHINFDWFRPLNCHRHTEEEVLAYCEAAELEIEHLNVQEAGIAVVGRKR